jgi:hypothetical protein
LKQEVKDVPGTDTQHSNQTIKVRILEGDEKGKEIIVDNDYFNLDKGEVKNLFLLRPQQQEVEQYKDFLPFVNQFGSWNDLVRSMIT